MLNMTANEFKTKLGVYVVFAFVVFSPSPHVICLRKRLYKDHMSLLQAIIIVLNFGSHQFSSGNKKIRIIRVVHIHDLFGYAVLCHVSL